MNFPERLFNCFVAQIPKKYILIHHRIHICITSCNQGGDDRVVTLKVEKNYILSTLHLIFFLFNFSNVISSDHKERSFGVDAFWMLSKCQKHSYIVVVHGYFFTGSIFLKYFFFSYFFFSGSSAIECVCVYGYDMHVKN